MAETRRTTKHIVVISDTHFCSSVALSNGHYQDDGGYYSPSKLQTKLWVLWEAFWEWAYDRIGNEGFTLVHNGDVIDGIHHKTTALSTHNLTTQSRVAIEALEPHVSRATQYYQIRGTESHVGQSAQEEEAIACALGAIKDPDAGCYSRWELWMKFGGGLINFCHHLGSTSSSSYESSALMREVVAAFAEAGQFGFRPPGIVVRGHTHRYLKIEGPGGWIGVKLPGFQAKTPFTYRIDRLRGPHFGGIIISKSRDGLEVYPWVQTIKQTKSVSIA